MGMREGSWPGRLTGIGRAARRRWTDGRSDTETAHEVALFWGPIRRALHVRRVVAAGGVPGLRGPSDLTLAGLANEALRAEIFVDPVLLYLRHVEKAGATSFLRLLASSRDVLWVLPIAPEALSRAERSTNASQT